MACGMYVFLCGFTYMLEVRDSKNRHFIVGDCYNNFLYNTDPNIVHNGQLNVLPTILRYYIMSSYSVKSTGLYSTMQAQINQQDHDRLIQQKIEGARCYKTDSRKRETGKITNLKL